MERPILRNIAKKARHGVEMCIGVGLAMIPILEGPTKPLEVYINCLDSNPSIEVVGDILTSGSTNWLVAEEVGSRRFRVLEKSTGTEKWVFGTVYPGFADPRSKYTEVPIGKFNFHQGKEYYFSIYSGGLSSRKTPLLDQRQFTIRQKIPSC